MDETRCSRGRSWLIGVALGSLVVTHGAAYPVTVENCGRELTFDHAPQRAVIQDLNMSEMAFALQIQPQIAGLVGITGWYQTTPAFDAQRGAIPELAPKTGSLETLVAAQADFFLAGWYYGMTPGGALTPDTLARVGIPAYVLTESCAHIGRPRTRATLDLLYLDELALGRIFDRTQRAEALVSAWKARVATVANAVRDKPRVRVFVYDSGEDKPFSAGMFAMPTAIIDAAGGRNVLDDLPMSWGTTSWEDVAVRNPQFLILLDYQRGANYLKLLDDLKAHPAMAGTDAVRNGRFIRLRYEQLTPGPANVDAVEALARGMYPDAFDGSGDAPRLPATPAR